MSSRIHVAVVGAGAFGGWTALRLLRSGAQVTLFDAWGPGNARASSGGETRIIRATYGPDQPYTDMSVRALKIWQEYQCLFARRLFSPTGVLWMATTGNDEYECGSLAHLREAGVSHEELSVKQMSHRWPQINFEGVRWGIYEPSGGILHARFACQAVLNHFGSEGGKYRQAAVAALTDEDYGHGLVLSDQSRFVADRYVFCCGPWLGELFPRTIGSLIRATRQDVFFFGTPSSDDRFSESKLPVWADHRDRFIYGMPAIDGRGFKIADDTRGPEFDPTFGERTVNPDTLRLLRDYLAFRFPAMKDAPLLETRVCQYESTPDNHFIVDRHPSATNVWIVGGGSGHGFKHGPALGEMVAELVMKEKEANPLFRLSRFSAGT